MRYFSHVWMSTYVNQEMISMAAPSIDPQGRTSRVETRLGKGQALHAQALKGQLLRTRMRYRMVQVIVKSTRIPIVFTEMMMPKLFLMIVLVNLQCCLVVRTGDKAYG